MRDLRFAVRMLLRDRAFATVAVLVLAVGIGANSAIFSVVSGVLLKPLPYRDPSRLVRVFESNPELGFPRFPISAANFIDHRAESRMFDELALFTRFDQQLGGEHPERLRGMRVSFGFFRLLGVTPMRGRDFTEDEGRNSPIRGVILSHDLWRRRFAANPGVIGTSVMMNDSQFTVVGVMPPGFEHVGGGYNPLPHGETVDIWVPLVLPASSQRAQRGTHFMNAVGRLKPGVTLERAQAEMNVTAARMEQLYPGNKGWRIVLMPLREEIVGRAQPMLLVLLGAVGFVLLIACVNVANLLLARATAREREMAVRAALGAGKMRLVRQMLTESVVLALAGGALGLVLAHWGIRSLIALGPQQLPRLHAIALDARVLGFTLAVALLTGVVFGLAPALQAMRVNLNERLKEGGRGSFGGVRHNRLRAVLVMSEVSLAFVLLIGAGLLMRSFVALAHVEPGFNPRNALTMNVSLSFPRLIGARKYAAYMQQMMEKLAQLPGVTAAGASSDLPWTGADDNVSIQIEGRPQVANERRHARYHTVTPNYFRAIGVPLVAGRWLTAADHFDAPKVLLINQSLALEYWPDAAAALGKKINVFGPWLEIVGVAGDIKDGPADSRAQAALYLPFLQQPSFTTFAVLRTQSDPTALTAAARRTVEAMGADASVQEVHTLEQVAGAAISEQRFTLLLSAVFAGVALLLAAVGIYAVMAYTVSQRSQEIGVRVALGAQGRDLLALIVRNGLALTLPGIAIGIGLALALGRVLARLLFAVSANDLATYAAVAALLTVVALAAAVAPARRALRVDPMDVLRHE